MAIRPSTFEPPQTVHFVPNLDKIKYYCINYATLYLTLLSLEISYGYQTTHFRTTATLTLTLTYRKYNNIA